VSIDPVLGRLAIVSGTVPAAVWVSYSYGLAAEIGGGFYPRPDLTPPALAPRPYPVAVADHRAAVDTAFQDQISIWGGLPPSPPQPALFDLTDGGIYSVDDLTLPAGAQVIIRARDGKRPVLKLSAPWKITLGPQARLRLSGVLVIGAPIEVTTLSGAGVIDDHWLDIDHCTLVPGLTVDTDGKPQSPDEANLRIGAGSSGRLTIGIDRAISGRLSLDGVATVVTIHDSVIDGATGTKPAIDGAGDLHVDGTTVLGATRCETVEASDCIFTGLLISARTQVGCVRFSFVPDGSKAPRCYRCEPAMALAAAADSPADQAAIRVRLQPSFTAQRLGEPGYAQLAADCPDEIASGGDGGSEMGAFFWLRQPQRLANLRVALEEYLRFGLEAGSFLVT
jgi:hypothetical protein